MTRKKKQEIGLYDSANGKTLYVQHRVHVLVSEDNPTGLILEYTTAKRGPLVKLTIPYEPGDDMGMSIHFFTTDISASLMSRTGGCHFSSSLGISDQRLVDVIRENAP